MANPATGKEIEAVILNISDIIDSEMLSSEKLLAIMHELQSLEFDYEVSQ